MKILFYFLLILTLQNKIWTSTAYGDDRSELLFKGNEAYDNKNYPLALDYYQNLLKLNIHNGKLYYNLGNIYFRLGELGKSIFYYLLAQRYIPGNGDLNFNLQYARSKTVDKIQNKTELTMQKISIKIPINFKSSYYLLTITWIFFWIFCILTYLLRRKEWPRAGRSLSFILLILSFSIVIIKVYGEEHFGVITNKNTKVWSAAGQGNIVLFSLNEGTEFIVQNKTQIDGHDWLQLALRDKKKGWVEKDKTITIP